MCDKVLRHFRLQADACERLGSPFMGRLLRLLADGLNAEQPIGREILNWPGDRAKDDALALRVAGGLHALVLSGRSPELVAAYPPEEVADEALCRAIFGALSDHADFMRMFLTHAPQTNETGRAAALAAGFQVIHQQTGLPLRLREVGASAGLNLNWDAFRIVYDGAAVGPNAATLTLEPEWQGPRPPMGVVPVHDRRGCDRHPLDLSDDMQRLRLRSYVWADQLDRKERLDAAIAVARQNGHVVDETSAEIWADEHLAELPSGAVTVLYHSVFWQYLPTALRQALAGVIEQAAARATADAPFAHLALEPDRDRKQQAALYLTVWPGGQERKLAAACYHGRWVNWSGG